MSSMTEEFDNILQSKYNISDLAIPPIEWFVKNRFLSNITGVFFIADFRDFIIKKYLFNDPNMPRDEYQDTMTELVRSVADNPSDDYYVVNKYLDKLLPGSGEYIDKVETYVKDFVAKDPGFQSRIAEHDRKEKDRVDNMHLTDPELWLAHAGNPFWAPCEDIRFNGPSKKLYQQLIRWIEKKTTTKVPAEVKAWVANYKD